jgi:hypothetical protein
MAGETIIDFSLAPEADADDSSQETIEVLAEERCFRECKMNLTNPARTDPTIATYSNQLVGLSLWAISNQKLIPNMMP